MMFSLSKSFTSSAVGLAVTEGRLSVSDRVISFFPEDLPATISDNLAAMTVRDLLTMTTGHAEDSAPHITNRADGNWARAFFEQPVVHTPGSHFVYDSGATYMLSAIVQKVTGQQVNQYLRPRLFAVLGIPEMSWQVCPLGINTGGWAGHRHFAIEPTTGRFDQIDRAINDHSAGRVAPLGRREWAVRWEVGD